MVKAVIVLIVVILAAAFFVGRGAGCEGCNIFGQQSEYCMEVARQQQEAKEFSKEYQGRFADVLHGCL